MTPATGNGFSNVLKPPVIHPAQKTVVKQRGELTEYLFKLIIAQRNKNLRQCKRNIVTIIIYVIATERE